MSTLSAGQQLLHQLNMRRGLLFGAIIVTALLSFEIFNYSTTEYALTDLLGELRFAGLRWATILSIAFCGIDFAGIARLFTPTEGSSHGSNGPHETWYLFGAWLLAATMNAMLTWWGVSLAVLSHQTVSNDVVSRATLLRVVPVFVALLVWLIRVLIIGTFSVAGDKLFTQGEARAARQRPQPQLGHGASMQTSFATNQHRPANNRSFAPPSPQRPPMRAAPANPPEPAYSSRPEPTYHSVSTSAATSRPAAGRPDPSRSGTSYRN